MALKERKIRVKAVAPGPTDTPMLRGHGKEDQATKSVADQAVAGTVMRRAGTADELASAVVFLASSDSSYITGIALFVDGGFAQV